MTRGLSTYLDAARFLAAIVVLLSHFAYPRFTDGAYLIIRELNLGSDAVVLFFVLSGFVIAYTLDRKDDNAGQFLFARMTRLYSVALPAIALTLIADRIGSRLDPVVYDGWWYATEDVTRQIVSAVSFTNESWFSSIRLGTNGPYWSLAYEAWFYLIFAAATFLSSWKRLAAILCCCLIVGPKIVLLFPIWWLGVATYRYIKSGGQVPQSLAWPMTLVPVLVYCVALYAGLPAILLALTKDALGAGFVTSGLRFSDEFIWNSLIGGLFAAHLIGVAQLLGKRDPFSEPTRQAIKWLAGATFSIYIAHYPLLQFFAAVLPEGMTGLASHMTLLVLVLFSCFVFASLFERRLGAFRAMLLRLSPRLAPARS